MFRKLKVLLKMDDLRPHDIYIDNWQFVVEYLKQKNVKSTFGVTQWYDDLSEANYNTVKEWLALKASDGSKLIELYNHGYDHAFEPQGVGTYDFFGTDYAYQLNQYREAQQRTLDKVGVKMTCFGAPYNKIDATTLQVLQDENTTKTVLFGDESVIPRDNSTEFINMTNRCDYESPSGTPNYSFFLTQYAAKKSNHALGDLLVLQGHPKTWDTQQERDDFVAVVDYLIADGVEFVLPNEIYNELSPLVNDVVIGDITRLNSDDALLLVTDNDYIEFNSVVFDKLYFNYTPYNTIPNTTRIVLDNRGSSGATSDIVWFINSSNQYSVPSSIELYIDGVRVITGDDVVFDKKQFFEIIPTAPNATDNLFHRRSGFGGVQGIVSNITFEFAGNEITSYLYGRNDNKTTNELIDYSSNNNTGSVQNGLWWKVNIDENYQDPDSYKATLPTLPPDLTEDQIVIYTDGEPFYPEDDSFWSPWNADPVYSFTVIRSGESVLTGVIGYDLSFGLSF